MSVLIGIIPVSSPRPFFPNVVRSLSLSSFWLVSPQILPPDWSLWRTAVFFFELKMLWICWWLLVWGRCYKVSPNQITVILADSMLLSLLELTSHSHKHTHPSMTDAAADRGPHSLTHRHIHIWLLHCTHRMTYVPVLPMDSYTHGSFIFLYIPMKTGILSACSFSFILLFTKYKHISLIKSTDSWSE